MSDWTEVLRWLTLAVGIAASIAGLAWTLGRIFRPWMRNEVRAGNDALYERLKNNDFRHVEDAMTKLGERIERVDGRRREDGAAMEDRIGERLERMETRRRADAAAMETRIGERFDRMEAHLLAAVRRPDAEDSEA